MASCEGIECLVGIAEPHLLGIHPTEITRGSKKGGLPNWVRKKFSARKEGVGGSRKILSTSRYVKGTKKEELEETVEKRTSRDEGVASPQH